jgi:uncharacterized coiled-coil DUF342 family protein
VSDFAQQVLDMSDEIFRLHDETERLREDAEKWRNTVEDSGKVRVIYEENGRLRAERDNARKITQKYMNEVEHLRNIIAELVEAAEAASAAYTNSDGPIIGAYERLGAALTGLYEMWEEEK